MTYTRKRILVLYTDCGYGHIATARALKQELERSGRFEVDLVDVYRSIFHKFDPFRYLTGRSGPDIYNSVILQGGHTTLLWPTFAALSAAMISLARGPLSECLARYCAEWQPDVVVSVMPLINGLAARGTKSFSQKVPFVTLITDMAEIAAGVWISDKRQFVICANSQLARRAAGVGIPENQIFLLNSLAISREFDVGGSKNGTAQVSALRRRMGLAGELLTGVMMFGGRGASRMAAYAMAIESSNLPVQMIYACGADEETADAIANINSKRPRHIVSLTDHIHSYMAVSDFYVGKPGPGSIAEAVQMELPMLLEFSYKTLMQERPNVKWAVSKGFARSFKGERDIVEALSRLINISNHAAIRIRLREMPKNTAIADVVTVLERLTL